MTKGQIMRALIGTILLASLAGCQDMAIKKSTVRITVPQLYGLHSGAPVNVAGQRTEYSYELRPTSGTTISGAPVAGQQIEVPRGWTGTVRFVWSPLPWDGMIGSDTCPTFADPCMACWLDILILRSKIVNPINGKPVALAISYQRDGMPAVAIPQTDAEYYRVSIEKGTQMKVYADMPIVAADWLP